MSVFAGIDSLIPLLVFIGIAIISTLMKKKAQKAEEESNAPLPSGPREKTWEEQIRDLMAGRVPAPPPPPPVIRGRPQRPIIVVPPPIPQEVISPGSRIEPHFHALQGLQESDKRYAEAATIEQRVMRHMHEATHHKPVIETAHRAIRTRSGSDARELLTDRRTLRAAIVASVILGPPRALQEDRSI
jgi:hypothetical protein